MLKQDGGLIWEKNSVKTLICTDTHNEFTCKSAHKYGNNFMTRICIEKYMQIDPQLKRR